MNITPQYTFDNEGNAVGVFLPMSEWKKLLTQLNSTVHTPQKEKASTEKKKLDDAPSLLTNWITSRQKQSQ